MRPALRTLAVCLPFAVLAAALGRPPQGTAYAFLVACQDYDEAELRKLTYPRADIDGFRAALKESGYKDANVVVMHEKQDRPLQPEGAKIRSQLARLLAEVEAEDSVVIAFAGHGVMFDKDPASYFCPVDARLDDRKTLVKLEDVFAQLKDCPAARKLMLVDACRNSPESALRRSRTVNVVSKTRPPSNEVVPKGVLALFSCSEGQESFEHPELGHGVFFHHVIAGWKESDNLDDFRRSVRKGTAAFVRTKFVNAVQNPVERGEVAHPEEWRLAAATPPRRDAIPPVPPKSAPAGALTLDLGGGETIVCAAIPAGSFTMGATDGDDDERPPHTVRISKGFWMGTTEVTVGQWKRYANDPEGDRTEAEKDGKGGYARINGQWLGPKPEYTWKNPGWPQTDAHPVVNVSWNDAAAFCAWLSKKTGQKVVLPSEAQWEYTCRAGTATKFHFGNNDNLLGEYAWFTGNTNDKGTQPVRTKKPNAWGVFDMHGNVWEWCRDGKRKYDSNAVTDPEGDSAGGSRVVRGGSFDLEPRGCRAAYRGGLDASDRGGFLGFRVSVLR